MLNINCVAGQEFSLNLIDFGTATEFAKDKFLFGQKGHFEWSAPETRRNAGYNEKCDIYSVACLLTYMLTGKNLRDADQRINAIKFMA